ncbi:MAG TPA: UDP-N-acetylmuramoyl-L-alanine--D-glutamate ligase [Methyloceanibacter sp.]|nr:UDP-N-acetylmuramoyl-L-alanine--D-glutamate ligase [Methyloceanibacter sp.]
MIPVTIFAGRDVAVFGLGLSGVAAAHALAAGGARVLAWDDTQAARDKAAAQGVALHDLAGADWSRIAALVLAPGISLTHPEPHWSVKTAKEAGVEVIGDTELFFREKERQGSGAKVVVITGTNGKSTTTALTAHLLEVGGRPVALGGNIGRAVLDLPPFTAGPIYVLELSTFQIDLTPSLAPDAAALINITPDHLDRHGTIENYAAIKARVFTQLPADGTAVIGVDDDYSRAIADALHGPYAVKRIAVGHPVETGVWAKDGMLTEVENGVERGRVGLDGIGSLRGAHNWQNAAVAYALARSQGLDASTIAKGLGTFAGLGHRMEQVARAGSVLFVNDSKATNADAAAKALASFNDIYWIVGGRPKAGGLNGLEPFFPKIVRAYLIGEASDEFAAQLGAQVDHVQCGTLDRAIEAAAADAKRSRAAEPVVLLSPACASYDQFANFEARGQSFCDLVMRLPGVTPMQPKQGRAA